MQQRHTAREQRDEGPWHEGRGTGWGPRVLVLGDWATGLPPPRPPPHCAPPPCPCPPPPGPRPGGPVSRPAPRHRRRLPLPHPPHLVLVFAPLSITHIATAASSLALTVPPPCRRPPAAPASQSRSPARPPHSSCRPSASSPRYPTPSLSREARNRSQSITSVPCSRATRRFSLSTRAARWRPLNPPPSHPPHHRSSQNLHIGPTLSANPSFHLLLIHPLPYHPCIHPSLRPASPPPEPSTPPCHVAATSYHGIGRSIIQLEQRR